MKVSVVTISYNQVRFLERALRSVLDQDYPAIEYIVVDPGSTDGSREVIARHASRFAHLLLEPDDGPADGLSRGLARASGELCLCVNADDALLPGAVSGAVGAYRTSGKPEVLHAHGYLVDADDRILRRFRSTTFTPWRFVYGGAAILQQSTLFRRDAFEKVGGFNAQNRTCWDAELLVDIALAGGRFVRVDDYWSLFRIHDGSISGTGRLNTLYEQDRRRLFEKVVRRAPRRRDSVTRAAARVHKWLLDPVSTTLRAYDAVMVQR